MKSISCWAKNNTSKARLLIVLSEILLFILAVRLGLLLLQSGIQLPAAVVVVPLFVFGAAIFIARYRKALKQRNRSRYSRQRLCFFLVGLSMFLLTVFMVSSEKLLTWNAYPSLSATSSSLLVLPAPSGGERLFAAETKKAPRLLKNMRKHTALTALLVLLIYLGGFFLLGLVASLSCSLSCNGNGALALLVLLVGGGGIIFLCVWLIQKLIKGKSVKKIPTISA